MGLRSELRNAKKELEWVESSLSRHKTNQELQAVDMEKTFISGLNTFSKRFEKAVQDHENKFKKNQQAIANFSDVVDELIKLLRKEPFETGDAKKAIALINKASGIADQAFFGPEPEFFIFDSVRFANDMGHTFFHVDSEEAAWNSGREYDGGNTGYRPMVKGGYFPVAPLDSLHDLRAEMCKTLEEVGMEV